MKQKLLNKLWLRGGMLVAVLCTLFAGQAWGDDTATITFANQTTNSDSGTAYTKDNFVSNGIESSDAAFGTITCSYTSRCYLGKKGYGMKVGASSNKAGSFTISFANPLTNVTKITLNRASYNNTKTATITVKDGSTTLANAVSTPSNSAAFSDMDITNLSITSLSGLTVETSQYCYIKSISITYSTGDASPLASIAVDASGATTVFHVGDTFTHEGATVTATYEDASTKDVTANATFSTPDMTSAGTKTVTVSYTQGEVTETDSYDITVNAPATLTSISLSGTYPTVFTEGDTFSSEGIVVTANYDDNTTADVTSDATFSGYDMSTVGEQTVTVSYEDKTTTYNITVNAYVQPTEFDINLNDTFFGTNYGGTASGISDVAPATGTKDNVTVTYAGSGNHYINSSQIRFYPSNKLTFEAPDGYNITQIVFTSAGTWAATISTEEGTYTSSTKTWEGEATTVLFTGSGSSRCDMSKATITLEAIVPKVLSSIALSGDYPTTFHTGDAFSHEGMTVTANYEGGKTADVTASATFSGYDMSATGEQTVTVSYTESEVTKTATYTITVNAPATLTGITLSGTYPTEFEQGDAFSSEGIVVTANYDDNTTSDVTAEATFSGYDMATLGEQTVIVTYGGQTASYTINVVEKKGTSTRPYTVSEITKNETGVYVQGIISSITEVSTSYGNATYKISEDGTQTNEFTVYRGKYLNNESFTSESQIAVGDVVVIYGNITTYSGSFQLAQNNYLISLIHKEDAGLEYATTAYTANLGESFSTPTLTNPNDLTVSYSSSNTGVATVDASTGAVTLVAEGETTITATFTGNDTYKAGTASYTLTVVDPSAPVDICELISISPTTLTVGDLDDFTLTATFVDGVVEDTDYEISWQSSDASILEVAGSTYEAKTAGVVTVTVRVEVLDETVYNNVQKEFTVTVQAPAEYVALVGVTPSGTAYALKNIATGNKLTGEEVDVVNGKVINKKEDAISWVVTENETTATIQDKDGKYLAKGSGNTDLIVSTTASTTWTIDVSNKSWTNTTGSTQRSFIYSTQYNYFGNYATSNASTTNVNGEYSSMPTAYTFADGYTRTVTAGSYGTICLPYDVAAEDFSGVKFYSISGKKMNGAVLEYVTLQEEDELVGGAAYLFQANEGATKLVAAYRGTMQAEPIGADVSGTGLTGTYTKQYIPQGKYVLKNGTIYYVDVANYVYSGANKAYIDLTDVPEVTTNEVKGICLFGEDFDFETGIMSVDGSQGFNEIYNLSGQRIQKAQRGVNIVNGKKVLF